MAVINGFKCRLTGLKPYTMYTISMRAKTSAGFSEYSIPVTAKTLEDGKILTLTTCGNAICICTCTICK